MPLVRINAGKIVYYAQDLYKSPFRRVNQKSIENLNLKGSTNKIKKGSQSKIEKFLTDWIKSIEYNNEIASMAGMKSERKPVFLTLTLPSTQQHSDIEIKRNCLMPFIQDLKRKFNLKYFFWKAEIQGNGNIHFHLIIDCYIDRISVQSLWNKHLETLNYVTMFEEKHKHRNPPTTHIEVITGVRKMTSYILKYVCKDSTGRLLQGRKWDASKELKNMKLQAIVCDSEVQEYINRLIEANKLDVYVDEHFAVFRFTRLFDWEKDYSFIKNREMQGLTELYNFLYNDIESITYKREPVVKEKMKESVQLSFGFDVQIKRDKHE